MVCPAIFYYLVFAFHLNFYTDMDFLQISNLLLRRLHLKKMALKKLGLDLIKQFQKVMIFKGCGKKIMVSLLLVIVLLSGFCSLGEYPNEYNMHCFVLNFFFVQLSRYVLIAQLVMTLISLPLMSFLR